jgi:transcriptional regulator GlxA family with amidase domain
VIEYFHHWTQTNHKEVGMSKLGKMLLAVLTIVGLTGATILVGRFRTPDSVLASTSTIQPLKSPATGPINVAFIVSKDTNVMDIAGAWETFGDVMLTTAGKAQVDPESKDLVTPFNTYTVSDSLEPVNANGLTVIPNYTFDTAPHPQIIVIPAQGGRTAAQKKWLLDRSTEADVTMSVCTGASMLAADGLLDGMTATTNHSYWKKMQKKYPAVHFVSGTRFVDHGKIATAGGLTSGIDLALHIVERYYGREIAQATAETMEYRGELWKQPDYDQIKAVSPAE